MLGQLLSNATPPSAATAIITRDAEVTWEQLTELKSRQLEDLAHLAGQRVGVVMTRSAGCVSALAALDELRCEVFLLDEHLEAPNLQTMAGTFEFHSVIREIQEDARSVWSIDTLQPPQQDPSGRAAGGVTILTSGTTGKPKAARHTWETLARPVRRIESAADQRWALTYRPQLYAGLQVILQCLVNRGTLVMIPERAEPNEIVDMLVRHRVTCCSATPSYWRRLALFADRARFALAPLEQITLGGEVVDQPILDSLRDLFPNARITHIYATTELGRCFSVGDGQAGFPSQMLAKRDGGEVSLKVEEGELWIRSRNAMEGYDPHGETAPLDIGSEGWVPTGDLVEIVDDRVQFRGRKSDIINVGGNKVSPLAVERVIRGVTGVDDVRVFGQSSSIAGQLVAWRNRTLARNGFPRRAHGCDERLPRPTDSVSTTSNHHIRGSHRSNRRWQTGPLRPTG